jgi:hypothetical protein
VVEEFHAIGYDIHSFVHRGGSAVCASFLFMVSRSCIKIRFVATPTRPERFLERGMRRAAGGRNEEVRRTTNDTGRGRAAGDAPLMTTICPK